MKRQITVHCAGDSTIISVDDAITVALPCSIIELENLIIKEKVKLVNAKIEELIGGSE